jgi:hypothetical protein
LSFFSKNKIKYEFIIDCGKKDRKKKKIRWKNLKFKFESITYTDSSSIPNECSTVGKLGNEWHVVSSFLRG